MKLLLNCSLAALIGVLIAKGAISQTVVIRQGFVNDGGKVILIKGAIAGAVRPWLTIEAHNGYQWSSDGFNPCLTRIVCDYKPIYRQLPSGAWEIEFTSPIAKDIP